MATSAQFGGSAGTVLYVGLRSSPLEWQAEIDAAAALGLRVHVSSDADISHTGLPPEQRGSFDHTVPITEQAARMCAGQTPVAVVCWGDKHVGRTARLADTVGSRGIGKEPADVTTDKAAQRHALQPYGLNPAWRSGTTVAELRDAAESLGAAGQPLVFKPAHCSGGRGVTLVTADTDLDEVFSLTSGNYTGTSEFVLERYADGSEHSVAGLVADGTVRVLGVADKYLDEPMSGSWATAVPSARTDADVAELERAAERAVRAVGLRTGGFHVDLRLTTAGPVVLEVGGRLGGDLINSHLIPLAWHGAVRPYEALLTLLTTGQLPDRPSGPARGAAMVLLRKAGRPTEELIRKALGHDGVTVADEWPGADAVVAVLDTETPADLPAAVVHLRETTR